jgi:outer membrane protein assembly factor BamA
MHLQSNTLSIFFARRLAGAIALLVLAIFPAVVPAQSGSRLERIQFVGLKRLTPSQVITLSGLKTGQTVDPSILDAAAAKLLESGLFRRLSYRVRNAPKGGGATVTFEVEESAVSLPVVFENFVWFSDQELTEAIRKELSFFNGTAPATGETPDKIAAALQRLLASRNISARVEYLPYVSKDKQELVFSVKGARIPVCSLHFPGASAIAETELVKASREVINSEYSRKDMSVFAPTKLLPLYRRIGHLRAEFQAPTVTVESSAQCPGGVSVSIPVEEGRGYRWAKSVWDGNEKLTVEDLATALGMNPGDIADGVKIDAGLKNVAKAYSRRGHLNAQVKDTVEYDDASSTVTYRFNITEGPRFFMGNLIVNGLPAADADELKAKWTLGQNTVFDDAYVDEFRRTSLREFISALRQRSRRGAAVSAELETRPNVERQSVDVVISFK